MKQVLLFFLLVSYSVLGQTIVTQEWDGFSQSFDVTGYQGGQFRFQGYVRALCMSDISSAYLFARVDKKKGYSFFDNMKDRPITQSNWTLYSIEGKISMKAKRLIIGGMYIGLGKYYFDELSLEIKKKDGEWESIKIINPGFEEGSFKTDWISFFDRGFESSLTTLNTYKGNSSLFVNTGIKKPKSKGKFVTANEISIHYEEFGRGDTVLLLHGNSESLNSFVKQIPALSKEFHVIALDLRGQGFSTKDSREITYELMAEDVSAFLDTLGIRRVNIVGWSDGGIIGLLLAMNHPDEVKSLSIMGANLFNNNTSVKSSVNRELKSEYDKLVKSNKQEDKFRIDMIGLMLYEPNINPDSLIKIQCPTLVMAGSKDVIKEGHTKLIASKIKDSSLVIFDKGTHNEPIENPERFNKIVIDFIKQLE